MALISISNTLSFHIILMGNWTAPQRITPFEAIGFYFVINFSVLIKIYLPFALPARMYTFEWRVDVHQKSEATVSGDLRGL